MADYVFVAKAPCGCATGAAIDSPAYTDVVNEFIAENVRRGNRVERLVGPVTVGADNCSTHTTPPPG